MERPRPSRLYLARHGKSTWNEEGRIAGQLDPELSALGRRQAERLARILAATPLDAVYCSPLERARQTAEATARARGLPLQLVEHLRERHFGQFQGRIRSELDALPSGDWASWRDGGMIDAPEGGEDLAGFRERVLAGMRQVFREQSGRCVLVVGHRHVNRVVLGQLLGLKQTDASSLRIRNTFVYEIVWTAEPTVATIAYDERRLGKRWARFRD